MSYLYDCLKEMLGGKSFSSGSVSKNWSPNEVRSVIIMRDFILVADYLKNPRLMPLDYEELARDLSNPNRRGNLNNLLTDRQLSCLEEIYVDEVFPQKFPNVIDLDGYIKEMYNTKSRLRYYGYVSGMDGNQLVRFYQEAFQQGKMNCTLAKDMCGFRYNDLGNDTWYKQYNLREQFYELDKPKGRLHTYFAKCQKLIGDELRGKEAEMKQLSESVKILKMFSFDVVLCSRISLLMKYSKFLSEMELPMLKKLGEALGKELRERLVYKGLTKQALVAAITSTGTPATSDAQLIMTLYQKCGVFDDTEGLIEQGNEGILRIGTRLSSALITSLRTARTGEDKAIWRLLSMPKLTLPDCAFAKELQSAINVPINIVEMSSESIDLLIEFVYHLGGLSEGEFRLTSKGGNE